MFNPIYLSGRISGQRFPGVSAAALVALLLVCSSVQSADLATMQKLPLFTMSDMKYLGGFRLPSDTYGVSDVTYAEGVITLGANGESIYIVGHAHQQAIGQFRIPALVNTLDISKFNVGANVQGFRQVLSRPATGNPQGIDRISGMEYLNGQLIVNGYVYYDASGGASHTTLVVKDGGNLSGSQVAGYHSFPDRAHASGWISPIPPDWQQHLGGTHISGYSSGKPIISRLSVGPSAFAFTPSNPDLGNSSARTISATKLLDYDLDHPIGVGSTSTATYLNNSNLANKMWTHVSQASYGFVVPGTRTYMTIGHSGGHDTGVGYKNTMDNGELCGGYCAYGSKDYYNYYWLFDVNDLLKVKAGTMKSYEVVPYSYGRFDKSYANSGHNPIVGGAFDSQKNILYLSLENGERLPWGGGWPVVVAFELALSSKAPSPPLPPTSPAVQVLP